MSEYDRDTETLDRIMREAEERRRRAEIEAETPEPLPPLEDPTKLGLGYYYLDGRYGDHFDRAAPYTNVYHCWWRMGYWASTDEPYEGGPTGGWKFKVRGAARRAFDAKKRILLVLDVDRDAAMPPVREAITLMAPFWSRVWLVDLFDEPTWSRARAEAVAREVRHAIDNAGLPQRPVGLTLDRAAALTSDLVNTEGLDWLGIEAYCDPREQNDATGEIVQRMKRDFRLGAGRFAGKVLAVGQSYTRNGQWTNMESLRRLQLPTYDLVAELGDRGLGIAWFAYGRPSGVVDCPFLAQEHRAIAKAAGLIA